MKPNSFQFEVYAYGERNQIIETSRNCLALNGVDLLDFKMFSDMLLNLSIELPGRSLEKLNQSFKNLGWKTELKLCPSDLIIRPESLIQGTVSLTFASGRGQRKDIIPAVPG